jgi:hypothetical protein
MYPGRATIRLTCCSETRSLCFVFQRSTSKEPRMRDRFNAFVERHEVARELTMALLAVV